MALVTKSYFGYLIKQRAAADSPKFFVFSARSKDIKKWAGFKRSSEHQDGTQRSFRESRLNSLAKFIKSNNINTIPNNILLAFDADVGRRATFTPLNDKITIADWDYKNDCGDLLQWGQLSFSYDSSEEEGDDHSKIALVIDGQHRLLGVLRQDEDLPIQVVAIIDCSPTERAFQFIVINNKSVKVPTSNVKSIVSDITSIEQSLNDRLLKAGVPFGKNSPLLQEIDNDDESPFKKLLDWEANREGVKLVPLTAIEQCLSLYKSQFAKMKEDEDSQQQLLYAIWKAVKENYTTIWGREDNYLLKKVSINAVNESIVNRLKFLNEYNIIDIFSPNDVFTKSKEVIEKIPAKFWTTKWSLPDAGPDVPFKVQDNANVRSLIKSDIEKILDNKKSEETPWFDKLRLISPSKEILD